MPCPWPTLTRSGGRVHQFPRLLRPWHTLGELRRSQFRVPGAAHAVDNAEQRRLRGRGEMLTLEGGRTTDAETWTRVAVTSEVRFRNHLVCVFPYLTYIPTAQSPACPGHHSTHTHLTTTVQTYELPLSFCLWFQVLEKAIFSGRHRTAYRGLIILSARLVCGCLLFPPALAALLLFDFVFVLRAQLHVYTHLSRVTAHWLQLQRTVSQLSVPRRDARRRRAYTRV